MVHSCLVYFRCVLLDRLVMHTYGGGHVSQETHMPHQSIHLSSFEAIDVAVPIGMYGYVRNRPGRSTTHPCYGCVSLETQL